MHTSTKLQRLTVALAIVATSLTTTVVSGPASAAPGNCDPLIMSEADLLRVAGDPNCLDKTLTQVADIVLTTDPWVPISNFVGIYDGNSKSITGLRLDGNNAGLFGVGVAGATIKNLAVTVSASNGGNNVGAIVGLSGGRLIIQNVQAYGTVTGSAQVGGLVGSTSNAAGADGTRITNSSFTGTVSATGDRAGGLVGITSNGSAGTTLTIVDSYVNASVSGAAQVGGLVGSTSDEDVIITNSSIAGAGSVTGSGNNVGGLVGQTGNGGNGTSVVVTNSTSSRSISGAANVGGLLGGTSAESVTLTGSSKTGATTVQGSNGNVGGLVGQTGNGGASTTFSITSSSATGDVTGGGDYVGGIVGSTIAQQVTISATSRLSGVVQGTGESVGGIIGLTGSGAAGTRLTIDGSIGSGNVIAGTNNVGGIVGNTIAERVTITNTTRLSGNVQAVGNTAGGLVGSMGNGNSGTRVVISTSDVTGNVSASATVGGLLGQVGAIDVSVSASSIVGNVTGTGSNVGGIIGTFTNGANGTTLSISGSTVVGNVTGPTQLGGLVGYAGAVSVSINSSSITGNTSGTGNNIGGLIGVTGSGGAGSNVTFTTSSVNGNVTSTVGDYVGGLLGFTVAREVTIQTSSKAAGNTSGDESVGGFVGSYGNGAPDTTLRIISSTSVGDVTGSAKVGGLIGASFAVAVTVSASSVYGNTSGSGNGVGGLIGELFSTTSISITQTFVAGNVSGSAYVGGLLGSTFAADVGVTNAFVRGDIVGSDSVGGLAGRVLQTLTVTTSYFRGTVTATNLVHGSFRGTALAGTIVISHSFCTDVNCPGANKIPDSDLKTASFLAGEGWDMTNVWCIRSGLNNGFPALRVFTSGALDATACIPIPDPAPSPSPGAVVRLIRVSLDPNGGVCLADVGHSSTWTVSILGSGYLPGPSDCTRPGHTFEGWADPDTPTVVVSLPRLADPSDGRDRFFVAENLDLIAVWTASNLVEPTPTPTLTFVGVRGWLCRSCGVLLFWTTPPAESSVRVVSPTRSVVCANSAVVVGTWTMCHVKTGRPGTYTLTSTSSGGVERVVTITIR